ncbi:MAG: Ig-like domain-containing protein [Pseudomonadota bacterium]
MNSNFMKLWGQAARQSATIFLISSLLVLTSCGGGSSSTTSTENNLPSAVASGIEGEVLVPGTVGQNPMPPATLELLPQVSVGQRQFADPNVLLNLRGTVVAAEGSEIVKTLWTQVTGPQVIISSPLVLENVILMPDVSVATQLEFRLTAEDSEGRVNSATVSVLIKPVPTFVKVVGGVFNEDDESAVFTVRLNAPSTLPISISYITQDGTATSEGGDYVFTSGEITLAAGEDTAEIPVALINDVEEEDNESFSLQVTAIDGEVSRANTGVAIIRNGIEPKLTQAITFTDVGPVPLYPAQEYTNVLTGQPPGTGDIIYFSSNLLVASVDAQGKVVALATGNAQITATKPADDVYLSATNSYSVEVGLRAQTIQFTSLGPVDINFKSVYSNPINPAFAPPGTGSLVYSSSNPLVATVDNQGKITVVALGTTTISAVKSADAIYSSAATSYELRVLGTGAAPVVSFSQSSAISRDGYSASMGEPLTFVGLAQDAEDGALPTAAQVNSSQATGLPITSLTWTSSLDGFLANGSTFSTNTLSMGTHRITYSARDSDGNIGSASIRVLVGNIAPLSSPSATSSTSGYSPFKMTDQDLTLTLGGAYSWSNANEAFVVGGPPRWTVYLTWQLPVTINMVDLYTTAGSGPNETNTGTATYALRGYEIEYWDGANTWLPLVAVTGNTALHRSHPVTQVTTNQLRVITHGSLAQTTFSRINELVVFGTMSGALGGSSEGVR